MNKFLNCFVMSVIISSSAFAMNNQMVSQPGKIKSSLIYLKNKIVSNKKAIASVVVGGAITAATVVACVTGYRYVKNMEKLISTLKTEVCYANLQQSLLEKRSIQESTDLKNIINNLMTKNKRLEERLKSEVKKINLVLAKKSAEELAQKRASSIDTLKASLNKLGTNEVTRKPENLATMETVMVGKPVDINITAESVKNGTKIAGRFLGKVVKKSAKLTWFGLKKGTPILWKGGKLVGKCLFNGAKIGTKFIARAAYMASDTAYPVTESTPEMLYAFSNLGF